MAWLAILTPWRTTPAGGRRWRSWEEKEGMEREGEDEVRGEEEPASYLNKRGVSGRRLEKYNVVKLQHTINTNNK